MEAIWLSWSSGKDSAWSYYVLSKYKGYEPTAIFTTVNEEYDRVAMHGTRLSILKAQSEKLDIPLKLIHIPDNCDNSMYEKAMFNFVERAKIENIDTFAFGDLFLKDVKCYRENQLNQINMKALFPLWGSNTLDIAHEMIDGGLKAIVSCVDTHQITKDFLGREFNKSFLNDLPSSADPCGENGEFHTCVYDSPNFSSPLSITTGKEKSAGQFQFIDLYLV